MNSLSSLTMYGQSEENKKKSVKSGRHEFSLSSLMGKMKKKKIISKVIET